MSSETFIEREEEGISRNIFSVSSGLIGVCLTVISLLHVSNAIQKVGSIVTDITALDALIFIFACFLSYITLKTKNRKKRLLLEKVTDSIFLSGLSLMVVICFFIVYAFTLFGAHAFHLKV